MPTPLPARSVALSLLLGSHPARMSPATLVRAGEHFDIPAATMRVALTRAVAAGDLRRDGADYALAERHALRQQRQDEAVAASGNGWDGSWEMAIVVVAGRSGKERAALRERLTAARLAELREGVWTRPANLRRPTSYAGDPVLSAWNARPAEALAAQAELAARLWQLDDWAHEGRRLMAELQSTSEPAPRLAVAAHLVRHLTTDPLLPAELLPPDWPGAALRDAYAAYQSELRDLTAAVA
ncbi:PaaX family transcriptional regulator C-terminal domain-containing protein [Nocardioides sp. AE5]|uniref:PaaX family transcriptional regulator C-terminal domain-containing protein n=1 Tax=Nocardioides sp. AE5 TaxID=2962573 RepID=UPI002882696A|nr:PaaX family transcriptional regulator C-terminal domain-containing protein [Nocardioides sp. AE5]MDT0202977.1 PaaX family transcriptional regulator C-terminal domain-containing protein [Nocardioides sp. AE5]